MPKIHIDVHGCTLQGAALAIGAVVEVSELSYNAMLKEGKGRAVDEDGKPVDEAEAPAPTSPEAVAEAEINRVKKALDDQYNLDGGGTKPGLKDAALVAGVEYPFDVKKADLIDLIMTQGKAPALLK